MASTVTIDLRHVARGLDFPLRQVQAVVELLDDGNTVPFITRYRKDQTGGLDEEQIREIQDRLAKMRLLAERKQTILRSIEAQGKLTEKLAKQILSATTTKRLEDLYLPFKPKKQTLATLARSRGLEELATEILDAAPSALDLDARARDYANPDRQVPTGADALFGAGHILAEQFSERADLRQRLREIMQRSGKIVTTQIAPDPTDEPGKADEPKASAEVSNNAGSAAPEQLSLQFDAEPTSDAQSTEAPAATADEFSDAPTEVHVADVAAEKEAAPETAESAPETSGETASGDADSEAPADGPPATDTSAVDAPSADPASGEASSAAPASETAPPLAAAARRVRDRERAKQQKQHKKDAKKRKIEERRVKAFRDYFNYAEDVKKIPPHRVLAINRAERAKVLRVKVECDLEAMNASLEELLVPPDHPHGDYLRGCARDALSRLILPALEREARRELTDRAESHAVNVFARNLRNLLLQPPVHNRRVLAVDPGFKSGCKLAAMDQFGNLLGHEVIYLIGNKPERKDEAKQKVLNVIKEHELTVVAIGNGTACRETEEFFAELISNELKEHGVAYVIVNEAGASVYSTSQLGREEFPEYDATLRGAVSIGRRLLDPLSELVKIDPANIGVGLYQHDVKAKHLEVSLDEVVESCVNYVGVDVNTASPALLRYVSGLNQLTARRVYEYRREHGPFLSREQLRQVPGFGDATFIQAAGFLKIAGGENPLDATWIHPESYTLATKVVERFDGKLTDLNDKEAAAALAQRMTAVKLEELAKDLAESEKSAEENIAEKAEKPAASAEAAPTVVADAAAVEVPLAEGSTAEAAAPTETATVAETTANAEPASEVDAEADAHDPPHEPSVGTLTLRDILAQLARPGRDPREDLPAPVFKQGVLKLEDLAAGMEIAGTILNVVDFGCFVDIGMHDSGLVHVSRLADRFIRDPHEVVAVGDIVRVWVMEVDKERRRVSLTMVRPGSERSRRPMRGEGGEQAAGEGQDQARGRRGDRPPRSSQGRPGGRPPQGQGQQGQAQQGGQQQVGPQQGQQGGRPQGGRPQGGRPDQGRRPQHAGGQAGPGGQTGGQAGGQGRPQGDRRGYGGPPRRPYQQGGGGQAQPREFKPKPKPIAPISDAMKKGKEPMRTFGDLMQFFGGAGEDKKPPEKDSKAGKKRTVPPASPPANPAVGEIASDSAAEAKQEHADRAAEQPAAPPSADPQAIAPPEPESPAPPAETNE